MNERAREVLVNAALSGHPQLYRKMHGATDDEGDCVLGLLHLVLHTSREEAQRCQIDHQQEVYGLTRGEQDRLIFENDILKWDFLTIARKHDSEP